MGSAHDAGHVDPDLPAHRGRNHAVVPGDDLHVYAQLRQLGDRRARVRLFWSARPREGPGTGEDGLGGTLGDDQGTAVQPGGEHRAHLPLVVKRQYPQAPVDRRAAPSWAAAPGMLAAFRSAWSSGFPPTGSASVIDASLQTRPNRNGSGVSLPSGPMAWLNVMAPSVRVPVLICLK